MSKSEYKRLTIQTMEELTRLRSRLKEAEEIVEHLSGHLCKQRCLDAEHFDGKCGLKEEAKWWLKNEFQAIREKFGVKE